MGEESLDVQEKRALVRKINAEAALLEGQAAVQQSVAVANGFQGLIAAENLKQAENAVRLQTAQIDLQVAQVKRQYTAFTQTPEGDTDEPETVQ